MAQVVCAGAMLACSFGAAPSSLTVIPKGLPVQTSGQLAATVQDMIPMANVMPFAMCMSPTNPQVAAATAAALGVLTPQPCIPVTTSPWTPGSPTVKVDGIAVLTATCQCMCSWGGVITVSVPGQGTVSAQG